MIKKKYHVLGVMSGTSLDGIDLCYVQFQKSIDWTFKILAYETIPYEQNWQISLANASSLSREKIDLLDNDYTTYLAKIISDYIKSNRLSNIDAICSHGHTILHQPEQSLTLQIGNKPMLARLVDQKVICDFRVQDVALGGQGAPLVPIGDALLFSQYTYCLNLGGFANVSFDSNKERIAFDICPVNTVLNTYAQNLGLPYDAEGMLAKNGNVNKTLLTKLNELKYYSLDYPKSLGIEWVLKKIVPLLNDSKISNEDVLATFVEHIAIQISKSMNTEKISNVLVTGGGAYNTHLIETIKMKTDAEVVIPNSEIIENKEALIFGLLGVLRLRNEINCLASVTGASRNHSSGKVYLP